MLTRKRFRILLLTCCLFLNFPPNIGAQDDQMWTNLGIYGGSVQDIAVDPLVPSRIFAATYLGRGLFLSQDGGASWRALEMADAIEGEDTFDAQSVYAVAVAPGNSDIVWAAHNYWVAKSTDGGLTWTHIPNSRMQRDCATCGGTYDSWRTCRAIAIDPANPEVVYVGTGGPMGSDAGGAVYVTIDGGTTWSKLNQGSNLDFRVEDLAVSPDAPGIIWAVTNSNGYGGAYDGTAYRSADGGQVFTPIQPKPATSGILAVAPKPDNPDMVFVCGGYGIVQLDYDGTQWNASYPVGDSRLATDVVFAPSDPNRVYASWMRPNDNYWLGDGLPKVSRAIFDGSTWTWDTVVPDPQNAAVFSCLAVHPADADILLGGDQGLGMLVSQDHGQHWTPINEGLDAVIVYDVDADNTNTGHMLAASGSGLYERPDAASAWVRRHKGVFRSAQFHPSSSSAYYGGGQGIVARTTDGGASWQYSNSLGSVYVHDIAVDPVDTSRIYITTGHYGRQVQRSLDGGVSFNAVLNGINQAGQVYSMNKVVIDPHDRLHLLAAGGNFYSPNVVGDLWQSPDGGDTWQRTGLTNVIVNAVLIDPADPMVIYAGCGYSSNGSTPLFKSSDGGVTWTPRTDGLPSQRILITDVWAASPDYAMAVGGFGTVILSDGRSATLMDSGTNAQLYGIFGLSASMVWAVGESGTILYHDGSQWASMDSGTSAALFDVWAAAPDQVMVVGENGLVLYFNGTTWQSMDSGTTEGLFNIFGLAGDNVYAVGDGGTIIHYDGTAWTAMDSTTSNALASIWGADPANLFAVGYGETVLHFNGVAWSVIRTGKADNWFQNVWGAAADNVYVTAGANGRMLHFDGATWSESFIAGARDTGGLWGSGANAVFVSDTYSGLYVFDGAQWATLRIPGTVHRSVTDLALHRTDHRVIYAATYRAGVHVSADQAGTWLNLGAPTTNVNAIASGSLYAATGSGMYQLTGTGVLTGQVSDAQTLRDIDNAQVMTDLGHQCRTIDGTYMMVVPAGIFDLFALADNYDMATAQDVTIVGSDVTRQDFALVPGNSVSPSGGGSGSSGSAAGGGYCFISALGSF